MSIKINGETKHEGRVVEAGMKTIQIMSDMWADIPYAVVLMEDGTYKGFEEEGMQAAVDATPDMIKGYVDFKAAKAKEAADRRAAEVAAREAATVRKGKTVKVVAGRKVPIGTTGKVFWMQEQYYTPRFRNSWKTGPDAVKIGIALTDAKDARGRYSDVVWTYLRNVEVVAA